MARSLSSKDSRTATIFKVTKVVCSGWQRKRDLHTASLKLWDELLNLTKLCGAYRSIIRRMRKENGPRIADKVVELDFAGGGIRFEVRDGVSEIEWH